MKSSKYYPALRSSFRETASFLLRFSGIPFLIRYILARKKVTILVYHSPTPEVLSRHLKYLSRRFNFITLSEFADWLYGNNSYDLPKNSLVMTFDDGLKSDFELLDTFMKFGVKPTIFLCTQLVDTSRHYWFREPGVDLRPLKECSNELRLDLMKKEYGFYQTREFSPEERQVLNKVEIKAMKDVVDFQSHSRFHPILPACTDQECRMEVELSRNEIGQLTGVPAVHFAYPNGDYSDREIEFLKKAGYLTARTLDIGWNDRTTHPYRLRMTGITDNASVNMMVVQMSGIVLFLRYFKRGSFDGNQPTAKINN